MNISDSRCTVTKKDVKKLWAGFMQGNMSMTGEITFEEVKLCAPFRLPPFNIVFCLTHATLALSSGCKKLTSYVCSKRALISIKIACATNLLQEETMLVLKFEFTKPLLDFGVLVT